MTSITSPGSTTHPTTIQNIGGPNIKIGQIYININNYNTIVSLIYYFFLILSTITGTICNKITILH